jgi:hypothetical protein
MCRVLEAGMPYEERVEVELERCLPACTRRRSVGEVLVRRLRRVTSVDIDVFEGRLRGIAGHC